MAVDPESTPASHEPDSTGGGESLTIAQAAAELGVHPNTLRKRIRKGTLPARLVDGPTGQEYRIARAAVEALLPALNAAHTSQARPSTMTGSPVSDSPAAPAHTVIDIGGPPPASDTGAIQTIERARAQADYVEQLLAPWRARVEHQAEEIGRLKAELEFSQRRADEAGRLQDELEHARQLLDETKTELVRVATMAPAQKRRWWAFWTWGGEQPAVGVTDRPHLVG